MDSIFSYTFEKSQMDENQKIRDRKMRSFNRLNKDYIRKKSVKHIIKDLENHGPAGLIHIAIISDLIGRPIKIWNADQNFKFVIGKQKIGPPINVEYQASPSDEIGHWTMMQGKDPDSIDMDLNSCLFSVIGFQTGLNPLALRKWTVSILKGKLQQLADQLDEILQLEKRNPILMIGGARYSGVSANDAKLILDKSQNAQCYSFPSHIRGHPRGHASYPAASGPTDSVENYSHSTGQLKSGFLSRSDQDSAAHQVLTGRRAQSAMNELNAGSKSEAVKEWAPSRANGRENHWPRAKCYRDGYSIGPEQDIQEVVMVLRHHANYYSDINADVLVHTFYPVLRCT